MMFLFNWVIVRFHDVSCEFFGAYRKKHVLSLFGGLHIFFCATSYWLDYWRVR